ncbi:MAG: phosphate acyltransferase PlsX [Planctomycetes bacterium]|nr:phosphate acyltransferase PlsX [Planctomycetota bacterium]
MRTALDAMGGDFAPSEIIKGAVEALEILPPEDTILLVGPQDVIESQLRELGGPFDRILVEHAEQAIGMDEAPVEALRQKPRSSISRMVEVMKEGRADAFVSAGNTGAVVAAAQMALRTLRGVRRAGISIIVPTFHGPVVVIDVGANIHAKPVHLAQYGLMASVYSQRVHGTKSPRVGLMSIGSEDAKGTDLVRETRHLLRSASVNFCGNAEGRDLFNGRFDVIVCDGFVGNVVLKVIEGMGEGMVQMLADELTAFAPDMVSKLSPVVSKLQEQHDYASYGGAPLLGIDGIGTICHGSSKARAIRNALKASSRFAGQKVNEAIEDALAPAGELQK